MEFFPGTTVLLQELKDLDLLHKFAHFKGLRLFFLSKFPEATFIQGVTSIPDSKIATKDNWKLQDYFCVPYSTVCKYSNYYLRGRAAAT